MSSTPSLKDLNLLEDEPIALGLGNSRRSRGVPLLGNLANATDKHLRQRWRPVLYAQLYHLKVYPGVRYN